MHSEPESIIEIVSRVFVARGNARIRHADPHTISWVRRTRDGHVYAAAYKLPDGRMTIREGFVIAIGRQLGYREPSEIAALMREIKDEGGEAV